MWIKFLMMLRVFEYTGHLIYMLFEVFAQLIPFMLVLLVSVFGYTEAFHSLSKSYESTEPQSVVDLLANDAIGAEGFLEGIEKSFHYSILLTLGEFDVDALDSWGWVLFLTAALFNLVILLNLVIAIISEVFTEVKDNRLPSFYKERAGLIADIWTVVPVLFADKKAKFSLLFFATQNTGKSIAEETERKEQEEAEAEKAERERKI